MIQEGKHNFEFHFKLLMRYANWKNNIVRYMYYLKKKNQQKKIKTLYNIHFK